MREKVLIIPTCTDLNRGDQALVLETKKIIDNVYQNCDCYMMSTGETIQCESFGIKIISDILKHPSRFWKKRSNINYNYLLKVKWGFIALIDFCISQLILNNFFRKIIYIFLKSNVKESLNLYDNAKAIFVKGGGFLHDYSSGIIGWYTIYYQLYHIKLAQKMKKDVFIMPNSYGPFKSKKTGKMVNNVLKNCKLVTARESISASSSTNNLNLDISLYPDLAFFLDKNNSTYDFTNLFKKIDIENKKTKLVAITVRPYRFYSYTNPDEKYMEYKKSFVNFIQYLVKTEYKVLLVVHTRAENDHENDEKCINEIINLMPDTQNVYKVKDDKMNCYDLKYLYGKCQYVIGTRFHSVIFALEQLIPCIAITYGGNKGYGIMKDLGLSEYAISIGELNSENLIATFEKLRNNEKDIKVKIKEYLLSSQKKYNELICKIKSFN